MKDMRRTAAENTSLSHNRNENILEEFNVEPMKNKLAQYK